MTLRLAALAQGRPLRLAALAQGRPLRLAALAQGRPLRPFASRRVAAPAQRRLRGATAWQAVITVAFVVIAGGARVLACPVCFGAEETSMVEATKIGIIVMLAITLAVQGAFVGFFLYLRKRAKLNAEIELDTEWSELQRASRTS